MFRRVSLYLSFVFGMQVFCLFIEPVAAENDSELAQLAWWRSVSAAESDGWYSLGDYGSPGSAEVYAVAVAGSDVYVGGDLNNLGSNSNVRNIGRWDGNTWNALGEGLNSYVHAIYVKGTDVYVGGVFENAGGIEAADYLARWDGSSWHAVGDAIDAAVYAIYVDDGGKVYIGGKFIEPGGNSDARYLAMWDGDSWEALGQGFENFGYDGIVRTIVADGSNMYVGGNVSIDKGNSESIDGVALWDGAGWKELGGSISGYINTGGVFGIAVSDTSVYVAGLFGSAGGDSSIKNIARWDGTSETDGSSWHAVGDGVPNVIRSVHFSGSTLVIGGAFSHAGSDENASGFAALVDGSWQGYGSGVTEHSARIGEAVYSLGSDSGGNIYAGGYFYKGGGDESAEGLTMWNGESWEPLWDHETLRVYGTSEAIAVSGSDVYVSGNNGESFVTRFNGSSWSKLGEGTQSAPNALVASNGMLYAGGNFVSAGGETIWYIAQWDGSSWDSLGPKGLDGSVNALVHTGEVLYVGGNFDGAFIDQIGNMKVVKKIGVWDGLQWNEVGGGLSSRVNALAYDGEKLYAGGLFVDAGGEAEADYIAGYDGSAWHALGSSALNNEVFAIAVSGDNVYVGGDFTDAGGDTNADRIALWNGSSWNALGQGLNGRVSAIAVVGSDVYVGGSFADAGGIAAADNIARWDGESWNAVGGGVNGEVLALTVFGANLFVGGAFEDAGGVVAADGIARRSVGNELGARIYALWNGFLGMTNILELVNRGSSNLPVSITLYDISGAEVSRFSDSVPANGQRDVILNDVQGFAADSYGIVTVDIAQGELDGRLSFYRSSQTAGEYEYAFAVPFVSPVSGDSAVSFNTFQPSLNPIDAGNSVDQWLSIVNLDENEAKIFSVTKYSDSGEQLSSVEVEVEPLQRRDIEGGHENPGPSHVGLNVIRPADSQARYLAHLTRYGKQAPLADGTVSYAFAFPLLARAGTAQEQWVHVSNGAGGDNWLELINAGSRSETVTVNVFENTGSQSVETTVELNPYAQVHIHASELLSEGMTGAVRMVPKSSTAEILAQSMYYFRNETNSIDAMYGSQAQQISTGAQYGSYNLYLGMYNWLRVFNASSDAQDVTVTVFDGSGSPETKVVGLSAYSGTDLGLHETENYGTSVDTFGIVGVSGPVVVELLRIKPTATGGIDFAAPTAVR